MKYIISSLVNAAGVAITIMAVLGNSGFQNVLYFLAGLSAFLAFCVIVTKAKPDASMPEWFKTIWTGVDVVEFLLLAYFFGFIANVYMRFGEVEK